MLSDLLEKTRVQHYTHTNFDWRNSIDRQRQGETKTRRVHAVYSVKIFHLF